MGPLLRAGGSTIYTHCDKEYIRDILDIATCYYMLLPKRYNPVSYSLEELTSQHFPRLCVVRFQNKSAPSSWINWQINMEATHVLPDFQLVDRETGWLPQQSALNRVSSETMI